MTKVDFYLIAQAEDQARQFFACRLVEKVLKQGIKVYVHTDSSEAAQEMDDLLWSFKAESFIPHTIVGMEEDLEDEEIPVLIGFGEKVSESGQLLINLCAEIPVFHHGFERIAEIVPNQEELKVRSRQHWNAYKDMGYELAHHQLN